MQVLDSVVWGALFRAPSIYEVVNLATALVLVFVFWRHCIVCKPVTSRQYERFAARLDFFEVSEQRRSKMDVDFRHQVIAANEAQLEATEAQNKLLEKVLGRTEYVLSTIKSRPCIVEEEKCPEGCDKA